MGSPITIKVKAKYIGSNYNSFLKDTVYTLTLFTYYKESVISLFDIKEKRKEYSSLKYFLKEWSYVTLQ